MDQTGGQLARRYLDFYGGLKGLSGFARISVALFCGAVSTLGFAPFDAWPVTLIAFVLLIWLLEGAATPGTAFKTGWWFGLGQNAIGLYWIAVAFQFQGNMPAWLGHVAVLLLSATVAIYIALAAWATARLATSRLSRVLLFAVFWTLFEWLRGYLFGGFPWNPVGAIWANWLPMAQLTALTGVFGLSFITLIAFALIALPVGDPGTTVRPALIGAALLAAVGALGLARLGPTPDFQQAAQQVHIVQANIGQDQKWDEASFRNNFYLYLRMTRQAISERGPGLVIWPETAIPNLIEEEITTRYLMARALDGPGLIFTGGLRVDRDANGYATAARNSLLVLDDRGHVAATYDKAHLVPFGEYLPLRGLMERLGLSRLAPGGIDFTPGPGPRTLTVEGAPPVSPLICYEGIFPGQVVDRRQRPAWLLNVSNDAWFGESTGPYQHLALNRLRAIEEGLPLVRSTPTGVSAVFDGKGRLVEALGHGRRAVLTAPLPAPEPATIFARLGDLVLIGLLAAGFCLGLIIRRI